MVTRAADSADHQDRLNQVLVDYLEAAETGTAPDRDTWLGGHPDLADELADFLTAQERVDHFAGPFRRHHPLKSTLDTPRQFGDYELLEEIGHGGMGVVYKARHKSLDRRVALKMLHTHRRVTVADAERFRTESEAAAHLDHPHIVPVYDVGEYDGHLYYSMKLIEGGSLAELRLRGQESEVRSQKSEVGDQGSGISKEEQRTAATRLAGSVVTRVGQRKVARLVATVARAVHHAHQRGVLHRDLKPSNILLDADDQPYVADFGLAKYLHADDELTQTGAIIGTPSYMAPEQAAPTPSPSLAAREQPILRATTSTDVYGLGAILYNMLTGRPPFQGATPLDTLALVKHHEPLPPSRCNATVDRDLEAICLKCLEKEPAQRYGSAEALVEDLERWLNGDPTRARPVGRLGRAGRWCRRNPLLAGLTALVATLIVTGVAGLAVGLVVVSQARQIAEDQHALLRQRLYAADLTRANRLWQEGQIVALAALLAQYEPRPGEADLRGFEWHFLKQTIRRSQQVEPKLTSRGRPGVLYYAATISADCKTAAGASVDRRIDVVDRTGELRVLISGLSHDVNWLSFSPDGQLLASASQDCQIRLWNVESGKEVATLVGHKDRIHCVVFSPDGKKLASCGRDQRVRIWDVARRTVELEFPLPAPVIEAVAFSPDGGKVAAADHDLRVTIWDLSSGESLTMHPAGRALSVAFAPDGSKLAAADEHGFVHVWQTSSGQLIRKLIGNQGAVRGVQFSPDGELLAACGDDHGVRLWSVADGTVCNQFVAHDDAVWSIFFSRDGRTLATTSTDETVKLWNVADLYQTMSVVSVPDLSLYPLRFSPDLQRLVTTSKHNGLVQVWNTATGKLEANLSGHAEEVFCPSFSRDGNFLAAQASGGKCIVWDLTTQLPLSDESGANIAYPGLAAILTPDNANVISSGEHEVTVSERATGRQLSEIKWSGNLFAPLSLTLSPDGGLVAVARFNFEICFWEWATGTTRRIESRHRTEIIALTFSPDGSILASMSRDGTIKLWKATTGESLATLEGQKLGGALAFSLDGRTLASASDDGSVKLWHVATAQELFSLAGHRGPVGCVAFSPDGQTLATAGARPGLPEVEYFFWSANPVSQVRKNATAGNLEVEAK